ncbi:MAG: serine--tRNA ligase [Alphaproteobacteria bacterium]|nr:serine--tRNA ligase [Alphaproteobacteria bacterium]
MHDIRFIRDNPQAFDAALARRGLAAASHHLLAMDHARRAAQTQVQDLLKQRNDASKLIGQAKGKGEDASAAIAEVAKLKDEIATLEQQERDLGAQLDAELAVIPNLPLDDVPEGTDETGNKEVRRWGDLPSFGFKPKEHFELGEALGLMDFGRAAKLSGARFTVLSGALARLERALGQFMLDIHTREFGYIEVSPPLLVNERTLYGTNQLPKFREDLFWTGERALIPTAEVPLTNLVAEEIVDEARLPLRFTALTACFRSEAGSAGKDTRGMLRQHQFYKVELVSIAHPDRSIEEHERMTKCAESVLQRLGLPYRVMMLCTGDMGFGARKTYDIEVWLPGQNMYREISSCSVCGDFQARRMNARFRPAEGKGNRFVHTLNGSGIAVGRALIAVLENYQQGNGAIRVPDALKPYMGGTEVIG